MASSTVAAPRVMIAPNFKEENRMELWNKIVAWYDSTKVHEQIRDVDYVGLFTNPWFVVPFACIVVWFVFKQKWKDIIILAVFIAVWWVSGTTYMQTLTVNGELQIDKILPLLFGGAAAMGLVIYLLFGRSD
jgi:hypothetical protein